MMKHPEKNHIKKIKRTLSNLSDSETPQKFIAVPELFQQRADEFPEGKVIFHYGALEPRERLELSYRGLNEQSDTLANYLEALNVNAADETMVGICMPRGIPYLIAIFAILKAGGTFVPLEHNAAASVLYKLKDTKLTMVIGDVSTQKLIPPSIQFISANTPIPANYKYPRNPNRAITPATRAYIMYTSGTTGNPKGVEIEHHSLQMLWDSTKDLIQEGIKPSQNRQEVLKNDGVLMISPFTFDASIHDLFEGILTPRTHLLCEELRISPMAIESVIENEKITMATFLATLLVALNFYRLHTLRDIICMGSPPKENVLFILAQMNILRTVRNEWGVTEATVRNTSNPCDSDHWSDERAKSIGTARRGCKIHILHPETLKPAATGEIFVEGSLARGYLNKPELTQQRFIEVQLENDGIDKPHPKKPKRQPSPVGHATRLYRTGDIGTRLSNGCILFGGRTDREIKYQGGIRVNLGAIENCLMQYPKVERAAILTQQSGMVTHIVAYIQMKAAEHDESTHLQLRNWLSAEGFDKTLPSQFIFCDIALTRNGKINYTLLPKAQLTHPPVILSPARGIEEKIAQLWQEVLGLQKDPICSTQPFTHYGGDSLGQAILETKINRCFKLKYPHAMTLKMIVMEYQTIQQQANFIDTVLKKKESASLPSPLLKSLTPTSIFPPMKADIVTRGKNPSFYFIPRRSSLSQVDQWQKGSIEIDPLHQPPKANLLLTL